MESMGKFENDMNLKATELRLGLPGSNEASPPNVKSNKRTLAETGNECGSENNSSISDARVGNATPAKQQVVGWPPVRSYRKNTTQQQLKKVENAESSSGMYVKVSMDGAPYLRKIDLNVYKSYPELLEALENMFKVTIGSYSEREGYNGSEHAPTYQDKDGDWMLVGDVPWNMFISSCKRLRIMRGSEARGLGCGV